MVLALGADIDAAEPAGGDPDRDGARAPDEVLQAERRLALGPLEDAEHAVHDREADRAECGSDQGRLAAMRIEQLGREQSADTEHRDEAERQRHERHATDVGAHVERVEDASQDVVDEDRDQQETAADQRAQDEDEVLDGDGEHRLDSIRSPTPAGHPGGRAPARADQRLGPKRRESQDSTGVGSSVAAPSRTAAEPGASAGSGGAAPRPNGISPRLPRR